MGKAEVVLFGNSVVSGNSSLANNEFWTFNFTTGNSSNFSPANSFWQVSKMNFFSTVGGTLGTFDFQLKQGSTVLASDNGIALSGTTSTATFTNIANYNLLSTTAYSIIATSVGGSGFFDRGTTTPTAQNSSGFTALTADSSNVPGTAVNFTLSGSTVPEPGTLLLGGIAACSGGAGAWWKRRKRKATQPETTDQPTTA